MGFSRAMGESVFLSGHVEVGTLAQERRIPAALVRTWAQLSAPMRRLTTLSHSSFKESDTLFSPPGLPGTHTLNIHT